MQLPVIIGVDGGGTSCKLVAVQTDGTVLGVGKGKGVNYNAIGMQLARERLKEAVDALLAQIGGCDCLGVALGSSALDARADEALTRTFAGELFPPEKLLLDSDVYVALVGARTGKPGVMTISGTGSMVVGLDAANSVHVLGGWGYKLDEPGGGYGIAIEGLKAAFMALEKIGPDTPLAQAALDFFKASDSRQLITVLYDEKCEPADIARFAGVVLKTAEAGDAISTAIAESQMMTLAKMTAKVLESCPHQVCLYGGVFDHSPATATRFKNTLQTLVPDVQFAEMELPPELGAVLMFMQDRNMLDDTVIENMKSSWRSFTNDRH